MFTAEKIELFHGGLFWQTVCAKKSISYQNCCGFGSTDSQGSDLRSSTVDYLADIIVTTQLILTYLTCTY